MPELDEPYDASDVSDSRPRTEDAVRIGVRSDDLDVNGHVRGGVYLAYADHARWILLDRAGIDLPALSARAIGPVNLETTVRFHAELRAGHLVEIATAFEWAATGSTKTSRIHQQLRRDDGVLAAEVISISGLLDLTTRRLIAHPEQHWRDLATRPELLGLSR